MTSINVDFASLEQYRRDGRLNKELRSTQIQLDVDVHAQGSCRLKQGLTEVLCLVKGPYQRPANSQFLLKIQYTMAPFSSLQHRKNKQDRQFIQFTQNVRRSFEGVIVEQLYKKNQIQIIVTVLQSQGSSKSAVMNCISLALVNAGICMREIVVSCTVGVVGGEVMIDLNEEEQYEVSNQFVISYLRQTNNLDCIQLKKAKIKEQGLKVMYELAVNSCQILYDRIKKALHDEALKKMLIF